MRGGWRMLQPVPQGEARPAGRPRVHGDVEQVGTEQADAGLHGGDIDFRAFPRRVAMQDRHEQSRAVAVGGLVVHVGQAPSRRLPAGQAADEGQPADRLYHRPVATVGVVRAALAETAHVGVDDLGAQRLQPFVGQVPAVHDAGGEILRHHTACRDEPLRQLPAFG